MNDFAADPGTGGSMTEPEELIDKAARPLAENALRRYASEYVADHLSADDFMDDAREDVAALAAAGLLADPAQGSDGDRWRDANGRANARVAELHTERDLALWLHAEAVWRRDELIAQFHTMRGIAVERRCRIDKALALLDPGAIGSGDAFTRDEDIAHFAAVRTALQPDKPEVEHG